MVPLPLPDNPLAVPRIVLCNIARTIQTESGWARELFGEQLKLKTGQPIEKSIECSIVDFYNVMIVNPMRSCSPCNGFHHKE